MAAPRSGAEQALLTGMNTLAVGLAVAGLAGAPLAGGLRRRSFQERSRRSDLALVPAAATGPDQFPALDDVRQHSREYGRP